MQQLQLLSREVNIGQDAQDVVPNAVQAHGGLLSIMRQVTNALSVVMNLLLIIANCNYTQFFVVFHKITSL